MGSHPLMWHLEDTNQCRIADAPLAAAAFLLQRNRAQGPLTISRVLFHHLIVSQALELAEGHHLECDTKSDNSIAWHKVNYQYDTTCRVHASRYSNTSYIPHKLNHIVFVIDVISRMSISNKLGTLINKISLFRAFTCLCTYIGYHLNQSSTN